jgi:hypothetical protein
MVLPLSVVDGFIGKTRRFHIGISQSVPTWHGICFRGQWKRRNLMTIMQTFSPELAPRWLEALGSAATDARDDVEAVSPAQQETLEALADRISAARAIA